MPQSPSSPTSSLPPADDAVALIQHVASGHASRETLADAGGLFLLHGGAGPADPKGPRAQLARQAVARVRDALAETLRTSSSRAPSDLPSSMQLPLRLRLDEGFHARGLAAKTFTGAEGISLLGARMLEEEPLFNAGIGAALQADGVARVSAGYMESTRQRFSAVMNIPELARASELAAHLQGERFSCLDAMGGTTLARDLGVPRTSLVTPFRFERWLELKRQSLGFAAPKADGKGTIGCVSVDPDGNLCAITSTGGVGNETPGRIGDTPTVAGNYCSSRVAVSCTGYGEQILACAFASRLATRVEDGMSVADAMGKGIAEAFARGFGLAAIAVERDPISGKVTWCTGTTEGYFIWAGFDGKEALLFEVPG